MRKIEIAVGTQYGRLTVLSEGPRQGRPGGQQYRRLLCACECGATKLVQLGNLKKGVTKSCGCILGAGRKPETTAGSQYGRLTVISEGPRQGRPGGQQYRRFHCECSCGATKLVQLGNLRKGFTKSCGCLRKERVSESNRTRGLTGTPGL